MLLLLLLLGPRAGRLWGTPLGSPRPGRCLLQLLLLLLMLLLLLGRTLCGVGSSSLSCPCSTAGVGRSGLRSSPRSCRGEARMED